MINALPKEALAAFETFGDLDHPEGKFRQWTGTHIETVLGVGIPADLEPFPVAAAAW